MYLKQVKQFGKVITNIETERIKNFNNDNNNVHDNNNVYNNDNDNDVYNNDNNDNNDNNNNDNNDVYDNDNDNNDNNNNNNDNNNEIIKNIKILDIFLKKMCDIFSYFLNLYSLIYKLFGIYLLWICVHYFASHLYVKICVPNTLLGFIMSPFMIPTPHCQGLRWIIYNAANMINNMWIITGSWICSNLLILKTNT